MGHLVIYKGEELADSFLTNRIASMVTTIRENGIQPDDVVICRANTPLGVYLHWVVCCKLNLLPVFVPSDFSLESIYTFDASINFKAVLDLKENDLYVYFNPGKYYALLKNIEQGSVIHLTSATTGNPKFVLRTKKQINEELRRYIAHLKINESDVIFPTVPLDHSFGFISGMLLSIMVGAKLVLPDMLLPRNIVKLSNECRATFMLGAPYFYKKMLMVSPKYNLNDELRYIIASGGPMIEGLQNEFRKRFNKKLIQQYGSTETGSLCIDFDCVDYNCVGKPIPGVKLKTIEDEFSRKCVYVDSPATIGGYVNDNSVQCLGNGLYMMGDLGEVRADGSLVLLGRNDDILIVNGKKLDKHTVTSIIKQINGILEANVFLEKHNDIEELICKYVGNKLFSKEVFVNHCKKVLADYQIPKKFIKVDYLSSGKVTWKSEC